MNTPTQTMTGKNNLADAAEAAIDLSKRYGQAYIGENIRHTANRYIIFTHRPFIHFGESLIGEYSNGELVK